MSLHRIPVPKRCEVTWRWLPYDPKAKAAAQKMGINGASLKAVRSVCKEYECNAILSHDGFPVAMVGHCVLPWTGRTRDEASPEHQTIRAELAAIVRRAVDSLLPELTDRQYQVFIARHPRDGNEATLSGIAKGLGISARCVHTHERIVLKKLKERLLAGYWRELSELRDVW